MVGLPAPKNFRMSNDDQMQSTYFRDDYMAQHLADEPDDDAQPTTSYGAKYLNWHSLCTETEQRPFVDAVIKAAQADPNDKSIPRYFFLTGAGGTGKTFTYNVNNKRWGSFFIKTSDHHRRNENVGTSGLAVCYHWNRCRTAHRRLYSPSPLWSAQ